MITMLNIKPYEAMAKLDLPDNERELISARAAVLVESFAELDGINTDGVQPLVAALDMQNALREDVSVKKFTRDDILSNAPEQYDGYFQVPKTVE